MSILIKGMEMPTDYPLWVVVSEDGTVQYNYFNEWKTAEEKAAPVPPHGDLIDRDALIDKILGMYSFDNGFRFCMKGLLLSAPTVIPASEEGERWTVISWLSHL